MEAIFKQSAQEVVIESQKVRARGGNMRVDTGFLRSSGVSSLHSPEQATVENPYTEPNSAPPWSENNVNLTLLPARLGAVFWFVYTANYARIREYRDGFVRLAARQWQTIVRRNVERAKRINK